MKHHYLIEVRGIVTGLKQNDPHDCTAGYSAVLHWPGASGDTFRSRVTISDAVMTWFEKLANATLRNGDRVHCYLNVAQVKITETSYDIMPHEVARLAWA